MRYDDWPYYYDIDGNPIDQEAAYVLMGDAEHKRIGKTHLGAPDGPVEVSTVFLVIDHQLGFDGRPMIFETMIFGGTYDGWQWRYPTKASAAYGHRHIVNCLVRGVEPELPDDD